jgi:NTE family protein
MLEALGHVGIEPDLAVGTSVGAIIGAVVAEAGSVAEAAAHLSDIWRRIERHDVFPDRLASQALRLMRGGSLFPLSGLRELIESELRARDFTELRLPLLTGGHGGPHRSHPKPQRG